MDFEELCNDTAWHNRCMICCIQMIKKAESSLLDLCLDETAKKRAKELWNRDATHTSCMTYNYASACAYIQDFSDCMKILNNNTENELRKRADAKAEKVAASLIEETKKEKPAAKPVKVDEEKDRTKKANKAKDAEKRRKEEYQKELERCARIKAEQERKKKQMKMRK